MFPAPTDPPRTGGEPETEDVVTGQIPRPPGGQDVVAGAERRVVVAEGVVGEQGEGAQALGEAAVALSVGEVDARDSLRFQIPAAAGVEDVPDAAAGEEHPADAFLGAGVDALADLSPRQRVVDSVGGDDDALPTAGGEQIIDDLAGGLQADRALELVGGPVAEGLDERGDGRSAGRRLAEGDRASVL